MATVNRTKRCHQGLPHWTPGLTSPSPWVGGGRGVGCGGLEGGGKGGRGRGGSCPSSTQPMTTATVNYCVLVNNLLELMGDERIQL